MRPLVLCAAALAIAGAAVFAQERTASPNYNLPSYVVKVRVMAHRRGDEKPLKIYQGHPMRAHKKFLGGWIAAPCNGSMTTPEGPMLTCYISEAHPEVVYTITAWDRYGDLVRFNNFKSQLVCKHNPYGWDCRPADFSW